MKKLGFTILKTIAFFILWIIFVSISVLLEVKTPALLRLWLEFIPFVAIMLITYIFVRFVEKSTIKVSIFNNAAKNILLGTTLGIIWLGVSIIVLFCFGILQFQASNTIAYLPLWFLAVLFNAAMQEFLVRGYIYQLIKRNYNTLVATIISTVIFTALHGGAFEAGIISVLNVVTMSVFVTLLLEYTQSLLAPIIVHFLWNAVGCVVFGAVTLAEDYPNIINTIFTGNAIMSGGDYKLEGSIVVLIINVLLIAFTAFLLHKRNRQKEARKTSTLIT